MKITADKRVKEIVENNSYTIQYGTIKKGADTTVLVVIHDVEHVSVTKTCGCTMPTVNYSEGNVELRITYDPKKVGVINQRVIEKVLDKGVEKSISFNLTGKIE